MSENSELIHWHLGASLARLLSWWRCEKKRALLWQIASYLICSNSSALETSRLGGKGKFKAEFSIPFFIGLTLFYFIFYFHSGLSFWRFKEPLLQSWPWPESSSTLLQLHVKSQGGLIKKGVFIFIYFFIPVYQDEQHSFMSPLWFMLSP